MNYQAIYNDLCLRGLQDRNITGRKERHHITPRHIGGNDDPVNLTTLTPKEHLLAHRLLYKMHRRWQDKLAFNALSGKCPEARSAAQSYAGQVQVLLGSGIHQQSTQERSAFGKRVADWNKANPEGMLRGLAKCHDRATQLRMAKSKAKFIYVDPEGVPWESRVSAAEHYGVAPHNIENWGKRNHYGWSRYPV